MSADVRIKPCMLAGVRIMPCMPAGVRIMPCMPAGVRINVQFYFSDNGISPISSTLFNCRQTTPNKISNWSLFKLIFSDQAIIASKQIFAFTRVFIGKCLAVF